MTPDADEEQNAISVPSALAYEDAVAAILQRRAPPKKRWWESVGIVSSLTAILTVAVTSFASYLTQVRLRSFESATALERAAYESEIRSLEQSYMRAADALHFADERRHVYRGDYSSLASVQLRQLVDSVNASDARWRRDRESYKIELGIHYADAEPRVLALWDTLSTQMDRYSQCAVVRDCNDWAQRRDSVRSAMKAYREEFTAYVVRHGRTLRQKKGTQ